MTAAFNPALKPSFCKGILGGVIGAVVGAGICFLVCKYSGCQLKLLAVGVGALAGWLADYLGKGEGSKKLGGLTALFVLAGIIGAQYLAALDRWHDFSANETKLAELAYTISVTEATAAVKDVPTGSDMEIRAYLSKHAEDDSQKIAPSLIPEKVIKKFRDEALPELQKLASGQITKEQFQQEHGLKIPPPTSAEAKASDNTLKGIFLLLLLDKMNLFSLAAAAGVAFKMCANV